MKKAYEFTDKDLKTIEGSLFKSILDSIEKLRALMSVFDMNKKEDSDKMWRMLEILIELRIIIRGIYKDTDSIIFEIDKIDEKVFYENREEYIRKANEILDEKNKIVGLKNRVAGLTHTLTECISGVYGDKLLGFMCAINTLMVDGDRSCDTFRELMEDIGIDPDCEYKEDDKFKSKVIKYFNKEVANG